MIILINYVTLFFAKHFHIYSVIWPLVQSIKVRKAGKTAPVYRWGSESQRRDGSCSRSCDYIRVTKIGHNPHAGPWTQPQPAFGLYKEWQNCLRKQREGWRCRGGVGVKKDLKESKKQGASACKSSEIKHQEANEWQGQPKKWKGRRITSLNQIKPSAFGHLSMHIRGRYGSD